MKIEFCARTVLVWLFVVFMFAASSFAQDIENLKKGVVKIEATTFEEKRKVGTGFIVRVEQDAAYIVTASHVVEGAREIKVEFFTLRNRLIPAEVIGMEGGDPQGLAALLIRENIPSGLLALKLASSIPVQGGESVTTIDFRRVPYVSWGVIQGNIVGQEGRTIIFSGPVDEGNSGGPLMKEGQVIGVVTEVSGNLTYTIPTHIAQYVLQGWGIDTQAAMVSQELTPSKVWTDLLTGMEFVWIPEGCFQMGQTEKEQRDLLQKVDEETYKKWFSPELPRHQICLDGFWMGKYEVTNAQYRKWKSTHNSASYGGQSLNDESQPVVNVSWEDAKAFTEWLTKQQNNQYTFRLPTEAEWEYAARARTMTSRYWDDDPNKACHYANVHDQTSKRVNGFDWSHTECDDGYAVTAPVGSFRPNTFGLYDMLGNVWEWC